MKSELAISALFLLVTPLFLSAQDFQLKHTPANVSDPYVVKPGDTLWGISKEFLGDPFVWTDLWKKNDFIHDPHWIYPGQKIVFGLKSAPSASSSALSANAPEPVSAPVLTGITELDRTSSDTPSAPEDKNVLRALRTPRPVFTQKNYMRTGFIRPRSEISPNKVIRIEGEQVSAIRYDTVITDRGTLQGVKTGDTLAVIGIGETVKHPVTGRDYGVVVRIKGILKVASVGENQSRCTVTETLEPLAVDDRVMTYTVGGGPLFDAWVRPDTEIRGLILAVNEPMISIHTDDILYIDKGERDGVRAGDIFTIFPRKSNVNDTGHLDPLGELAAISVMPGETAVLVTSLKGESISIGDRVELTARCRIMAK